MAAGDPPEPDLDTLAALLLVALDDGTDDRRAALLLRWLWLEADRRNTEPASNID